MTKTSQLICNLFKINGISYHLPQHKNSNPDETVIIINGSAKDALNVLAKIGSGNLNRSGRSALWQKGSSFLYMVIDANDEGTLDLTILDFSDTLEKVIAMLNEYEIKYSTKLTANDLQIELEPHSYSLTALQRLFLTTKGFALKSSFSPNRGKPQFVILSGSCTIKVQKDMISLY
jgi:hypothetical protein